LSKAANGPAALKVIIKGNEGKKLQEFAFKLCGDLAEAQELVQEACYRALINWEDFDQTRSLIKWVSGILHNCFIDSKRQGSRSQSLDWAGRDGGLSLVDTLADGSAPIADTLARREEVEIVANTLAQLTPDEREILMLCDLNGEPYKVVAQRLGLPVGTIQSRLSRARAKVRRQFSSKGSN
jgi:RNA polymerase sigma-70 factor (ECF subfamily)